jgi:hypothetical protein
LNRRDFSEVCDGGGSDDHFAVVRFRQNTQGNSMN